MEMKEEHMVMNRTPLYEEHIRLKGKMVNFAGWEMPLQYSHVSDEVMAVRNSAGVFDVSHMGEIYVEGTDAIEFVDLLVTNDVRKLKNKQICYTPMCYENGTIVDDLLVYRFSERKLMMVVNASNTEKDFEWITSKAKDFDVKVSNRSSEIVQIAFQGPKAEEVLSKISQIALSDIRYYHFLEGRINGIRAIVSRTGYTGEDGFEIYLDKEAAFPMWRKLLEIAKKVKGVPCGLAARDILRFESSYMLYGNDIDSTTTPLEAPLKWTVKFDKKDFIGKKALEKQAKEGTKRKLIGFEMLDKSIPRHGCKIFRGEEEIGYVTSGNHSPTLSKDLGMGYLKRDSVKIGTDIEVEIRGKRKKAKIIKLPFYKGSVRSQG